MPYTSNQFINPLSLSTLDGIIGATFNSGTAYDASGNSVASAGDVNGDGIDDMLIGASDASPGNLYAGSTYLIFGHTGVWDTPLNLSKINGTNGVVINGINTHDHSGYSVASAQDVNGDGIDDVLIGATGASPGNVTNAGSTYLIFGHTGAWPTPLNLASLNGNNGVVINGIAIGDGSGTSVTGAGDVNRDGFDDVLIGAPYAAPGSVRNAGSTYLIFGHAGTWNTPLALSSLNGTNGVAINGIAAGDLSGWSVASALDVNGDNIGDLIIGAPALFCAGSAASSGSTYLIFGHTGAWSTPLVLSSLNGTNGIIINGIITHGYNGYSVASAGDVNGDGISDVMMSAYGAAPLGRFDAGSTYLIFGHTGAWNSPLSLFSLNGTNGLVMNGIAANDCSGFSIASAKDVNGDGIDDVLIGAYQATPGGLSTAGSTYLVFGHTGTWDNPLSLSNLNGTNGVVINGVATGDRSGRSVGFAGDVNGDGIGDMLIGAYQASPQGLTNAGSTYLIFGDSLQLFINSLAINQGQTIIFNNSMVAAYHPRNLAMNASIPFRITNITHGTFSTLNFLQNVFSGELVSFTHDNSIYPPSFDVTVGNWATVGPIAATISFDAFPVLYVNPFSVSQGKTVVLTNQTINATSLYYPADALMFSVSNVLHGNFIQTNTLTIGNQFNQSTLTLGQIAFATDGSANAPSYDITVSDGRITTPAVHGIVNFNATPTTTNTNAIIATVVTVGAVGLLFFVFQRYMKKRENDQLQKVLLEGTSDADKAFNIDVVGPITNKIFEVINTKFCGQRTEIDTKAYMVAIGKIISELKRQNANLDFNTMEPIDRELFIKEIANQTRQQSLPKPKGFSLRRCTRYFIAEVTPQEIEYAAESIASSVVIWQERHFGGVSAKNTSLGLEPGKQSGIEFSNESTNDGVPSEKEFKWMQNHIKAMEQREQKHQHERKQLEERVAQQEAELAALKQQGITMKEI